MSIIRNGALLANANKLQPPLNRWGASGFDHTDSVGSSVVHVPVKPPGDQWGWHMSEAASNSDAGASCKQPEQEGVGSLCRTRGALTTSGIERSKYHV